MLQRLSCQICAKSDFALLFLSFPLLPLSLPCLLLRIQAHLLLPRLHLQPAMHMHTILVLPNPCFPLACVLPLHAASHRTPIDCLSLSNLFCSRRVAQTHTHMHMHTPRQSLRPLLSLHTVSLAAEAAVNSMRQTVKQERGAGKGKMHGEKLSVATGADTSAKNGKHFFLLLSLPLTLPSSSSAPF